MELVTNEVGNVECHHYKYGYFTAPQLLVPLLRWFQVLRFERSLRGLLATRKPNRVVVVAHSFGTHIVGHALQRMASKGHIGTIDTVIFAGSVLLTTFDWNTLIVKRIVGRVINDCGLHDFILRINQALNPLSGGAGRLGFVGFTGVHLFNRYFRGP